MENLQALQPLPPFVPVSPRIRDLKKTRLSSMPGRRLFAHTHRIHVCYIWWHLPSIYPSHVSIYSIHGSYGICSHKHELAVVFLGWYSLSILFCSSGRLHLLKLSPPLSVWESPKTSTGKERETMAGKSAIHRLVGGIPTPLKNMSSSVGIIIPNICATVKTQFMWWGHGIAS